MRPLTDDESSLVFEKLSKFLGDDVRKLIDTKTEPHVFRLHKNKVFYMSERLLKASTNFARNKLLCCGISIGKFTKSGKFRLTVQCLDLLAKFAKHKVWLKKSGEMGYVYGRHVAKASVAKMTENVDMYDGVVVLNEASFPLGFGVAAQASSSVKSLDPTAVVVLNQADVGMYLRDESELA